MAGIYIHIPFCKTRCVYCDFYSTTESEMRSRYIAALCREIEMRGDYLKGEPVETIYFGGGTPSQLTAGDFAAVFAAIERTFGTITAGEITLEANPDDLTEEYLASLSQLPFNRISMGIQTFRDDTLRLLNRRHNAQQAIEAVARCRRAGFRNISIDLIYGLPGETEESWAADLRQAIALDVEHISAYHLIYEEGTRMYEMLQQHRVAEVDEDSSVSFFAMLIDQLTAAGYEHYEISNFCRPGRHSRHNTSYWQGIKYLGCGPSAHSFDGESREWNVSSLHRYVEAIEGGGRDFEKEELDLTTRYNEYIITTLRTRWGADLALLEERFGTGMKDYCLAMARPYIEDGRLTLEGDTLRLNREGIFVSDGIMSDLLQVDDD
jgi:oxygen-independent coproporphyrinogen-3 oxidase